MESRRIWYIRQLSNYVAESNGFYSSEDAFAFAKYTMNLDVNDFIVDFIYYPTDRRSTVGDRRNSK